MNDIFWEGFEKEAVSNKWLLKKFRSGAASRVAKSLDGIRPHEQLQLDHAERILGGGASRSKMKKAVSEANMYTSRYKTPNATKTPRGTHDAYLHAKIKADREDIKKVVAERTKKMEGYSAKKRKAYGLAD
jgi:hypothetical protein